MIEIVRFFGIEPLMDNDEIFRSVEKPKLAYEVARQIAQAIKRSVHTWAGVASSKRICHEV